VAIKGGQWEVDQMYQMYQMMRNRDGEVSCHF
jgi:hypothetical protein